MFHASHGRSTVVTAWLRRRPLFGAALAAVIGVVLASWSMWVGCLVGCLIAVWVWRRFHWRAAMGIGLVLMTAISVSQYRQAMVVEVRQEMVNAGKSRIRGVLLENARGSERFWVAPVRLVEPVRWSGQRVWWQGRGGQPVQGSRVRAEGEFQRVPSARNPGEFDRAAWLGRLGVAAIFQQERQSAEVATPAWAMSLAAMREGFRERLTLGLDFESVGARVIRAVVMGERPSDAVEMMEAFRYSGTLHVFSVSGLHVGMVATLGWLLLSAVGVPRSWAVWVLLPWIFGYALLTGANPPAVRAAWMAAVFLAAFALRRKPDLLNALGAVLLVGVLWDGRMLFQPGVQLSYGVVAAIGFGGALAARAWSWLEQPELYLPRQQMGRVKRLSLHLRQAVARALGVSATAGIGAAPLTAVHFGILTPISIFAAVVLVPMVFVLLLTALVSVAISPVAEPLSKWINRGNAHWALGCVGVAEAFAAVPGGHVDLAALRQPQLLVYDLDRGEQALCFSGGDGSAVMLDCGGRNSFRYRVLPSLQRLRLEPDSVVISHPDGGHLGGGSVVWESLPVRQVLLPVREARSKAYRSWVEDGAAAGIEMIHADEVRSVPMPDGAVLEVLRVPDADAVNALADNRVMVSKLYWRGWKLLWTSDAGMGTEHELLDAGRDLSADVIIAGKHRWDLIMSDRFMAAVHPRLVIIGNDAFPAGERVDDALISHWKDRGVEWVDQSQSGGVLISVDRKGALRIDGYVDGREWQLKPD